MSQDNVPVNVPSVPNPQAYVEPIKVDPRHQHSVHLARIQAEMEGKTVLLTNKGDLNRLTPKNTEQNTAPEAPTGGEGQPEPQETAEATPAEAASSSTSEGSTTEGAPSTPVQVAKDSAASRLAKSLEIQKRAEAASKRAKQEADRIKQDRLLADKTAKEARELKAQAEADKLRISQIEAEYQSKLNLLKTNPLEFASKHGVSGAEVAEFVKQGADPRAREIALLRQEAAEAIRAVKDEAETRYKALESRITAKEQAQIEQGFLNYVSEATSKAPEAYQAMDVVYSPNELVAKAHELAEKNDRLQLGWNPDRLLEEIENEAKADPRWQRIQSKFLAKTSKETPKDTIVKKPVKEERPVEEVRATESKPRNTDGTFQGNRTKTPMEAHRDHVARIARSVRF